MFASSISNFSSFSCTKKPDDTEDAKIFQEVFASSISNFSSFSCTRKSDYTEDAKLFSK